MLFAESARGICFRKLAAAATFVWRPKVDKRYFRLGMREHELNLSIRKRERFAIIAPKCEGKTSFLCALAGVRKHILQEIHI